MKVDVVAFDYDGTVATRGALHPAIRPAAAEARRRGISVILVTGRILSELEQVAGDLHFVDAVVAENGAVLAFPSTGYVRVLEDAPPPTFLGALRRGGILAKQGQVVVEADSEHGLAILAVIQEQQLPLSLVFNRDRVMALPQTVNKATGLRELLRLLRRSEHNAIGIGDAENDHALLTVCEIGGAVAWGSPVLQAVADAIVPGDGPAGVAAYILQLAAQPTLDAALTARHRVTLGTDEHGHAVSVPSGAQNLLVTGERHAGVSLVSGLLAEQLILQRYSVCIIDLAGEQRALAGLPGVIVLGSDDSPPSPSEVARALRFPDTSVLVDLASVPPAEQPAQVAALLAALAELRRRRGWPHRVVVDGGVDGGVNGADALLHALAATAPRDLRLALGLDLGGVTLVASQPSAVPSELAAACATTIRALEPGEALLFRDRARAAGEAPVRVRLAPRLPQRPLG